MRILELLKPFWAETFKYAGIMLAGLLMLFKARQSGKEAVERKQAMETLKGLKIRDKIENTLSAANDTEYDRLRKKWSK